MWLWDFPGSLYSAFFKQMTIPWRNLYPDDHHSACEWPCIWPAVFGGSNQDGARLFFAATYPDDDQRDPLRPPAQLRDGWGFLEAPDPPAPSHYTALPDITGQPLQCISAFYQKLAISCRCFRQHYSALEVCDTLCVLRNHLRWFGAFLGNIAKNTQVCMDHVSFPDHYHPQYPDPNPNDEEHSERLFEGFSLEEPMRWRLAPGQPYQTPDHQHHHHRCHQRYHHHHHSHHRKWRANQDWTIVSWSWWNRLILMASLSLVRFALGQLAGCSHQAANIHLT